MFDTYLTLIGNVMTAPEWRRTTSTNALVANFKVASTSRRFDRDTGKWIDGHSLRVRVNCWRRLAEGVAASLMVGDPVVIVGRLYTRDWTDDQQQRRSMYELEAVAVGHDLSRGRSRFIRTRSTAATSMVDGVDADARVHGELTELVRPEDAPAGYGDGFPEDDDFEALPAVGALAYDPMGAVGISAEEDDDVDGLDDEESGEGGEAADLDAAELEEGDGTGARRRRRRTRTPVPA